MKKTRIGFKVFLASALCLFPHMGMASNCTQSQIEAMVSFVAEDNRRSVSNSRKIRRLTLDLAAHSSPSEMEAFENQHIKPRNESLKNYRARAEELIKKCDTRAYLSLSNELASSDDMFLTKLSEEADRRRQEHERIMQEAMKEVEEADKKISPEEAERFNNAAWMEFGSTVLSVTGEPAQILGEAVGKAGAEAIVGGISENGK